MTITTSQIKQQLESYRQQARQARAIHERDREHINSDSRRSSLAKNQDIKESHAIADRRITQASQDETDYLIRTRESVSKQAFGIGLCPSSSDIVAFRDASDRVAALTASDETQALEMYERAAQVGDKTMVAALFSKAYETGMQAVLDVHQQHEPTQSRSVEALQMIDTLEQDPRALVAKAFAYASTSSN